MQKKIYFGNLDALRFIAAMMVFFSHKLRNVLQLSTIKNPFANKVWGLISAGRLGVILFFVLSGFLITYLLLEEQELTGKINVKNFYFRRVLRIWPLYYLVLLISFGIYPLVNYTLSNPTPMPSRLLYYLSFLSNFDLISIFKYHSLPGNDILMQDVTWSVSIEEQFYLFWPLLFLLFKPRYYIFIFISTIIASMAWRFYIQKDSFVLWYHTLSFIVDLSMGGLSAYLVIKYKRFKDFFSKIPPRGSLLIYFFGFGVLLYRENLMDYFTYGDASIHLFYGAFFSFIILDQNFSPASFLKLGRYKFLSFWGKYSYGIYLLHPVAIVVLAYFTQYFNIVDTSLLNYILLGLVCLALTLVMSYVSYQLYEKRFLLLKKRFSVIVKE